MKIEDYTVYLGYIMVAILLYLIIKTIIQNKKKESFLGFGESSDSSDDSNNSSSDDSNDPAVKQIQSNIDALVNSTKKTLDRMNLVKYRSHWEDLIIAMEDRVNSLSLQAANILAIEMKNNPESENIMKTIGKLNELNKYVDTLKDNMTYLDGLSE